MQGSIVLHSNVSIRGFTGFGSRPDLTPPSAKTRSRSGAGTDVGAVSPSPSRASVGVKPSHASPSRSVSDSGEGMGLSVGWHFTRPCIQHTFLKASAAIKLGETHIEGLLQMPRYAVLCLRSDRCQKGFQHICPWPSALRLLSML